MAVTVSTTNKPLIPRAKDYSPSPIGYNRGALYSGKALDFDGVNDKVTGSSSSLPASGYTIATWFNLDTLKACGLLTWGDETISERRSLFVWNGGSGSYYLYSSTYGSNVRGNTILSVGRWYFGAVTLTTEGEATIYLNGNQDGLGTNTLAAYTGTTYKIGDTGSSEFFDGEISGVRVFNTALTAAQVADLYLNPEKIVPDGVADSALKLWLPMMEGAGTTAYDGSGNGNHGTISGATWVSGIGSPVAQTALVSWNKGTNLVLYSEQFDNWTRNARVDLTTNDTTAPDGTQSADKIELNDTGGNETYYYVSSVTVGYTLSVFVKKDTARWFCIGSNSPLNNRVFFDLDNGVVGTEATGYTGAIEAIGTDGWYRCSATIGTGASSSQYIDLMISNADGSLSGTVGDSVWIWGASVTQSSSVQPYIPTGATNQTSPVLLPQGLTANKDITGVNAFESARNPYALNLDGASWGEVHDNASLDFGTGSFSLEVWAKLKYVAQGSSYNVIMSMGLNISNPYSVGMLVNQLLEPIFIYNNTGTAESARTEGEWVHIVGTYDETRATIYVNGVQKDQDVRTAVDTTNPLVKHIGRDTTSVRFYNDQLALPRIYNRALTATEVARNYNADRSKFGL